MTRILIILGVSIVIFIGAVLPECNRPMKLDDILFVIFLFLLFDAYLFFLSCLVSYGLF